MEPMRRSQPRLPRLMMLLPLGAAVGLLAPGCWKQPSTAGLPCNSASECDAGQQCVAGECAAETDSASAPGVTENSEPTTAGASTDASTATTTGAATTDPDMTSTSSSTTEATTDATTTGTNADCPPDRVCLPSADWVVALGEGDSQVTVEDVAIDGTGAAIVAGNFIGTIDIGGTKLQAGLFPRIFLIKFRPDSSVEWTIDAGDSAGDEIRAIAVDPASDSIFMTGAHVGGLDFGGTPLADASPLANLYLGRLKSDGTQELLVGWTEQLEQFGNDLMLLDNGDVVVIGDYQGDPNLGGPVLVEETGAGGSFNVFVARFDDSFGHVWSNGFGLADKDERGAFAQLGPENTIYIGGTFTSQLAIPGTQTMTNMGDPDGFVARLGPGGMGEWAVPITAAGGTVNMSDLASDDVHVYVLGSTNGTIQASPDVQLPSAGQFDIFALALKTDGAVSWGDIYGTADDELASAIAVDSPREHVLLSSMCRPGTTFGDLDDALTITGNSDMCFARLQAVDGAHVASTRYGGSDPEPPGEFEFGGPLTARGDTLYMSGYFFNELKLGNDELLNTSTMYARPWFGRFGL